MIIIALPWPDKSLSPNGRAHHMVKARSVKAARKLAWAVTLEALEGKKWPEGAAHLNWSFHPKTKNSVDDDNAISSNKAHRDGIADAMGIDDKNFRNTYRICEPVKGGKVVVTITPYPITESERN